MGMLPFFIRRTGRKRKPASRGTCSVYATGSTTNLPIRGLPRTPRRLPTPLTLDGLGVVPKYFIRPAWCGH